MGTQLTGISRPSRVVGLEIGVGRPVRSPSPPTPGGGLQSLCLRLRQNFRGSDVEEEDLFLQEEDEEEGVQSETFYDPFHSPTNPYAFANV